MKIAPLKGAIYLAELGLDSRPPRNQGLGSNHLPNGINQLLLRQSSINLIQLMWLNVNVYG